MPSRWKSNPRLFVAGLWLWICAQHLGAQEFPDLLLTNAAQIRQLAPSVAAQQIPARIHGVVTYYDLTNHLAFVQDVTAGTYVDPVWRVTDTRDSITPITAGLIVELSGRTQEGRFAPFLSHNPTALILGQSDGFPEPLHPMRHLLLDPTFHSQWVELDVFIRDAELDAGRLLLRCAFGPRNFDAFVTGDWKNRGIPASLKRSDARIRGVYGSIFNDRRQLVDMRLFVPSVEQITVLDPGMAAAFARPPTRIGEIMQFNPHPTERIHLTGTVLAHIVGESLYLRGADGAIRADTPHADLLLPGQTVDVVGFPRAGQIRPLLLDTIVKAGRLDTPPAPIELNADQVQHHPIDGDLVRMEARLIDHFERPGNSLLLFQSDDITFHARLLEKQPIPATLKPGSWVRLTGVCVLSGNGNIEVEESTDSLRGPISQAVGFSLILRGLNDIEILRSPPWWTPGRLRSLGVVLFVVTGAAFLWGAMLRRKVHQQTAVIADQVRREQVAEERSRIARELHDTLEQQLVGITMQLDTAASRIDHAPDRARASIDLARAMLRRSQTDARQSVWDLRSTDLSRIQLDEALREMVEPLNQDSGPQITVETKGPFPTRLDGVAKNHLLRIAQESLTNSLKHASAKHVHILLSVSTERIELEIRDDGRGFKLPGQAGAHFGLMGIRERAAKLNAALDIESRPGRGTSIRLSAPTSHEIPS